MFNEEKKDLVDENIKQIKGLHTLISRAHQNIGEQQEERAILIMGESGAGKSTLACMFAGKSLIADQSDEGDLFIDMLEPVEGIKIGHNKVSETHIPNKIVSESGLVIWDCQGFGDLGRGAMQDIANAFYVQRLFETTKELKFVLAIPEHHTKGRGGDLIRVVEHFVKIFKDIDTVANSVSLVVTQAAHNRKKEHIKVTLQKILEQNQSLDINTKKMFEYLTKSIEIFPVPKEPGILEKIYSSLVGAREDAILTSIEQNTEYLQTNSEVANVVISENSQLLANELFNTSSS